MAGPNKKAQAQDGADAAVPRPTGQRGAPHGQVRALVANSLLNSVPEGGDEPESGVPVAVPPAFSLLPRPQPPGVRGNRLPPAAAGHAEVAEVPVNGAAPNGASQPHGAERDGEAPLPPASGVLGVLIDEVRSLQAEVQTLRSLEADTRDPARQAPPAADNRADVLGLVGGMLVAVILIAIIVVVIARGG